LSTKEVARNGYQLIIATGMLDGHTVESHAFSKLLERPSEEIKANYVLDLSSVEYINSSMLGLIIKFMASCQEAGTQLCLLNPSTAIFGILEMIGLTEIIPTVKNEKEACDVLGLEHEVITDIKDIDYKELENEIEDIIVSGDEEKAKNKRKVGQLRKLLGNK
jgi:anti-anti-sigma factor